MILEVQIQNFGAQKCGPFLAGNNFYWAFSKILTKIKFLRLFSISVSIQKNIWRKICLKVFISKLKNTLFQRSTNFFFLNFFLFLKSYKRKVINHKKWPKWRFCQSITFFVRFQKYLPKEHLCVYHF